MQALATHEADPARVRVLEDCAKRSFLKLPCQIDVPRLLQEYNSIPASAWGVSPWDVHCSINIIQLRGGGTGTADDFVTADVRDNPLLEQMPYFTWLLSAEGPFGGGIVASIARTKPNGITRGHSDEDQFWERTVRIHVPIVTNPGALLLCKQMAVHMRVGEVWSFDNQQWHSVVNGDAERVHMLFDVNPNPKLAALIREATFEPGVRDEANWIRSCAPTSGGRSVPVAVAIEEPLSIPEKKALDLNPDGFASRVVRLTRKGTLLLTPLKKGDIVIAVNGVDSSVLSRAAIDYMNVTHKPGDAMTLDILRNGARRKVTFKLRVDDIPALFKAPFAALRRQAS